MIVFFPERVFILSFENKNEALLTQMIACFELKKI